MKRWALFWENAGWGGMWSWERMGKKSGHLSPLSIWKPWNNFLFLPLFFFFFSLILCTTLTLSSLVPFSSLSTKTSHIFSPLPPSKYFPNTEVWYFMFPLKTCCSPPKLKFRWGSSRETSHQPSAEKQSDIQSAVERNSPRGKSWKHFSF